MIESHQEKQAIIKSLREERQFLVDCLKESQYDEFQSKNIELDKQIKENSKEADYLLKVYKKYQTSKSEDPELLQLKTRF